jgi:hypothetical protein
MARRDAKGRDTVMMAANPDRKQRETAHLLYNGCDGVCFGPACDQRLIDDVKSLPETAEHKQM